MLSMLSGASFMLALLNGISAVKERPVKLDALMLTISSLGVMVYSLSNTRLYSARNAAEFMQFNRIDMFCSAIIIISLYIFIKRYTHLGSRIFQVILIGFFSIVPFIRLLSETTLTYTAVRGIRYTELLWGEKLSLIDADISPFGIFYFIFALVVLFYMTSIAGRYFIAQKTHTSLFLFIGTFLLTLTAVNDIVVDSFNLHWIYLMEFGYTGMLLFMTVIFYYDLLTVAKIRQSLIISRMREEETKSELNIKEQDYREIFNSSMDAIIVLDIQSEQVLDVNDSMLTIFECSRQDVLGGTMEKFHSRSSDYNKARFSNYLREAKEKGHVLFEWLSLKKSGDLFWTEIHLKYSDPGTTGKIIAVVHDISERKATQEVLIQSEKMMSLGGLAAGMAHEINNPLAGIIQTSNVLQNRLIDKIDSPVNRKAADESGIDIEKIRVYMESRNIQSMLSSIRDSGKRITDIVNNMLSFSRKSEGKAEETSIESLIERTLYIISSDYDLKKNYDFRSIALIRDFGEVPDLCCVVSEIQQVLINIFRNGAQAMHAGKTESPTFTIRTSFEKNRGMIILEIEDNGPGMPEEVRKRIFEPFYTTKSEGVGTGLGLSVSYYIIKGNHKGDMTVRSEPGSGTTFRIELPSAEK